MTCAAVVTAAGRGERLGVGDAKALRSVAGLPLVAYAVRALDNSGCVDVGVVVAPAGLCPQVESVLASLPLAASWRTVAGGHTRQESVQQGLWALSPDVDVVLVHDAARPFVPVEAVRRVVDAVAAGADAVVPVVPVADTVKQVDEVGVVVATPDRSLLRQAQTPQGFRRGTLVAAYASAAGRPATDDAGLVEEMGGRVVTVDGDPLSFKVTGPIDLVLAEALAGSRG